MYMHILIWASDCVLLSCLCRRCFCHVQVLAVWNGLWESTRGVQELSPAVGSLGMKSWWMQKSGWLSISAFGNIMHICIYIYIYYIYIDRYVCIGKYMYTLACVYTQCTYIHVYILHNVYIYIYTYIYICKYTYIHLHIYIYICMYMYT